MDTLTQILLSPADDWLVDRAQLLNQVLAALIDQGVEAKVLEKLEGAIAALQPPTKEQVNVES